MNKLLPTLIIALLASSFVFCSEKEEVSRKRALSADREESARKRLRLEDGKPLPLANPKKKDKKAFQDAYENDAINTLDAMLTCGYPVNDKDYSGYSLLHQAILEDNLKLIKVLLKHEANANLGCNGDTPLTSASINAHPKIIQLLLNYGANPFLTDGKNQYNALQNLINNNHSGNNIQERIECMTKLLEAHPSLSTSTGANQDKSTPMHIAAKTSFYEAVPLLQQFGANINDRDIYGNTPLHETMKYSNSKMFDQKMMETLITHGADALIANANDLTPCEHSFATHPSGGDEAVVAAGCLALAFFEAKKYKEPIKDNAVSSQSSSSSSSSSGNSLSSNSSSSLSSSGSSSSSSSNS